MESKTDPALTVRAGVPLALAMLLVPFLFIGNPGSYSARSAEALWDLGHTALFALAMLGLLRTRSLTRILEFRTAVLLMAAAGLVAIGIEVLQGLVGRSQSAQDVLLSVAGAWFGLWIGLGFWRGKRWAWPAALISLLLALAAIAPATLAFADEAAVRRDFPVLSEFTSDRELSRWILRGVHTRVPANEEHNGALRFTANGRDGLSWYLAYAPRDWSAFAALEIRIHLAGPAQPIVCRLNDLAHDLASPHVDSDHYEETLALEPGWMTISIQLASAAEGLATRRMNLREINGLTCFLCEVPSETTVLVDYLRLVPPGGASRP